MKRKDTPEPIQILVFLCIVVAFFVFVAKQAKQMTIVSNRNTRKNEDSFEKNIFYQNNTVDLEDVLWLGQGWRIDLSDIKEFPVVIINYDNKTCTIFKKAKKNLIYEVKNPGRYTVISTNGGKITCLNGKLQIM